MILINSKIDYIICNQLVGNSMEDINYLLNDESNNDKILIKELSIYIKNHRDNNIKTNKKYCFYNIK